MDAPPAGTTSLVSQSGTMLGTVLSRGAARGLGFSKLVSVGNEADIGVGELVGMLAADPGTRVILLFLETVRDAPALAAAARKAHAAGKPVVAYKLGRSELGQALARSHTGAMAGQDAALDAFFRDCGIARVDMLETLIEIPPLLSNRSPRKDFSGKPKVAVVTTTGGGAASVVDRLGLHGIDCVAPGSDAHIIDLTMAATKDSYRRTLEKLLDSPECDAVLSVVGSSAQFHPQLAVQPILDVALKSRQKPLAAFLTPHADASLALLAKQGIPAFRTPEACADALAAYFAWRAPKEKTEGNLSVSVKGISNESEALELFGALGIPVVEQAIAQAPAYSHAVSYPVAAKKLGLAHKTEAGGVRLGVLNLEQFRQVARAWGDERILVQKMEQGLAEAIVGYRDDPVVGPLVLVGAGGTLAELYNDYALRLAPVTEGEAEEMISQVKGLAAIRGYRGLPRGDVKALAQAVCAFSRISLIKGRPVAEAEINPVIVKAEGVVAVDGLVVLR
jgi:acyl-CoA synthetase (NDP forming)